MRRTLITTVVVLAMLMTALAAPALAHHRKAAFRAHLTTGAELHEVVDSDAEGRFAIRSAGDGFVFRLAVKGLTGPSWGVHLHGPATASENGGILVGLCGAPEPNAAGDCHHTADGTLRVTGKISAALLDEWGTDAKTLAGYMADGLVYVNVHTDLNAAGEVRGQIYR